VSNCCESAGCETARLRERQRGTLIAVLVLNAVMFVVEAGAGIAAASTALLADAADMLGDTLVYAFSLWVVDRGELWKARAATLKGGIMVAFGLAVLGQAAWRALDPALPDAPTMGAIGALALAVNLVCLGLLWRHRGEDLNMDSVWLCSRNDIVANVAVLGAGGAVALLGSRWPDLVVGVAIAGLFLRSGIGVLREARSEQRRLAPVHA
jgi:Co/Zn/Cd efflux system component